MALGVKQKLRPHRITSWVQQSPHTRLGLPFLTGMVLTLVVLTDVFKHRIETDDARRGHYEEREALGLGPKKRPLDLREEYFRLSLASDAQFAEWENKRVPRLEGQAEWGEMAEGYADIPGSRWQPGMKRAPPPKPELRL